MAEAKQPLAIAAPILPVPAIPIFNSFLLDPFS